MLEMLGSNGHCCYLWLLLFMRKLDLLLSDVSILAIVYDRVIYGNANALMFIKHNPALVNVFWLSI